MTVFPTIILVLKESLMRPSINFTYFSDGVVTHKKCRNFFNFCCHENDFGIPAEWHPFATVHGKGVWNGKGGTVKSLKARANLQQVYTDPIMTLRALYEWASSPISGIEFLLCNF